MYDVQHKSLAYSNLMFIVEPKLKRVSYLRILFLFFFFLKKEGD